MPKKSERHEVKKSAVSLSLLLKTQSNLNRLISLNLFEVIVIITQTAKLVYKNHTLPNIYFRASKQQLLRRKAKRVEWFIVAQPGFEPGLDGSEPPVLPLDDRAKG